MGPKVTERRQSLVFVGTEEAAAVAFLGKAPPNQPHGDPDGESKTHHAGGLPPALISHPHVFS